MVQIGVAAANKTYQLNIQVDGVTVSENATVITASSGSFCYINSWMGLVPANKGVRVQFYHNTGSAINLTGYTPVNNFTGFRVY